MLKKIFNPIKKLKIKYYSSSKVFDPNLTSILIIKAIDKNKNLFKNCNRILDLGCGTGVLGISIKKILKKKILSFSDFSDHAVKITKKNVKLNNIKANIIKSNLMTRWKNENFDLIINDVSAISTYFKNFKLWYNSYIPCDSGLDGTKNTLKFIDSAPNNCKNIVIPLISLSNISKIKKKLNKKKLNYKVLIKEYWPLPKNLVNKRKKDLIKLKKRKIIDFKVKFGMLLAYTEIIKIKL